MREELPERLTLNNPTDVLKHTDEQIERLRHHFLSPCENIAELNVLSNATSDRIRFVQEAYVACKGQRDALGLMIAQVGGMIVHKWLAEQAISFEEAKKEI